MSNPYERSDRAYLLDPRFNPECDRFSRYELNAIGRASLSYIQDLVHASERKLEAVAELFSLVDRPAMNIDPRRLAGCTEILEEIAADMARINCALDNSLGSEKYLEREAADFERIKKEKRQLASLKDE